MSSTTQKAVPLPRAGVGADAQADQGGLPVRMVGAAVMLLRASAIVLLLSPLVVAAALLLR